MAGNRKGIGDIITALTIAVLFVVILSLVVFAARGYQNSVEVQDHNGNIRAFVSYIANSVRDGSENVSIEQRSGTECLIISGDEGYEMRDFDTISSAINPAETGALLFSTLHTSSAANTINRIVDVFPANQQVQVRGQLAQLIRGVVCQQLVTSVDGHLIPVFEVLKSTPAIHNMIREGKLHQLESAMQAASQDGMVTMDSSLLELYNKGQITKDTLLTACNNYEFMVKKVGAR